MHRGKLQGKKQNINRFTHAIRAKISSGNTKGDKEKFIVLPDRP